MTWGRDARLTLRLGSLTWREQNTPQVFKKDVYKVQMGRRAQFSSSYNTICGSTKVHMCTEAVGCVLLFMCTVYT